MTPPAVAVPRTIASFARRRGLSALANARSAAEAVGASVAERSELMRLLRPPTGGDGDASTGALQELSATECLELLRSRTVGRLAYIARAGRPDIVPVNYAIVDGNILIRSGPGPKLQAAERREHVAFEADVVEERTRTGWSVVRHGTATRMSDAQRRRHSSSVEPWADGASPCHQDRTATCHRTTDHREPRGPDMNTPAEIAEAVVDVELTWRVGDVMSAPAVTVSARAPVTEVLAVMQRTGVRHVIVMDAGRCVGVLDDRRVVIEWALGQSRARRFAADLLPDAQRCVFADTPVASAAEVLMQDSRGAVPVCTADGGVVGIVTTRDLLRCVLRPMRG